MEAKDLVTSYPLINDIYHLSRNQFRTMDSLKKNVSDYIAEQAQSEEESSEQKAEQQIVTRKQAEEKSSTVSQQRGRPPLQQNSTTKKQKVSDQTSSK